MKKFRMFFTLIMMAIACIGTFTACSSDNDSDGDTPPTDLPKYTEDAAKYEITDENAAIKSIELTESGQYIVIMNDVHSNAQPYISKVPKSLRGIATRTSSEFEGMYYGNYTKTADGYYKLEDFGTVRINKNDNGTVASVTVHSNISGNDWTCPARLYSKSTSGNSLTNSICRTWNFEEIRYVVKVGKKTLADIQASSMEEFWTKMKKAAKENADDEDEDDAWTDEDEASYNELIADAKANPLQQFIFTESGSWIIKNQKGINGISLWRWKSAASNELQTWLYDYDLNGDDVPNEDEWKNLFFSDDSEETPGKTIARFEKGKLVLEDTMSETDEDDGMSYVRICTVTLSEAK